MHWVRRYKIFYYYYYCNDDDDDFDSKTHKRLNRTLFNNAKTRQNANFRGHTLLQSHKQYKNRQITQLLAVACFQKDVPSYYYYHYYYSVPYKLNTTFSDNLRIKRFCFDRSDPFDKPRFVNYLVPLS